MAFTLNPFKRLAGKARKKVNNAVVDKAVDTVVNKHMTPEEITAQILKMNVAKVDRAEFLNKELKGHYPEETVQTAIEYNPAYAGSENKNRKTDVCEECLKNCSCHWRSSFRKNDT